MAQYSRSERKIAFILAKFPGLKSVIKKLYQRINFFRYKKSYTFKSEYPIKCLALKNKESYFGYYDKSPINITNEYVIFHSTTSATTLMPNIKKSVDIVLYDVKKEQYETVGSSSSYNWQQGSKLMWVDDYKFIFNDFDNAKYIYISKIYDLKSKETKVIDYPIYDCHKNKFAISLNFERLNIARADYSYNNLGNTIDWTNNTDDGLYFVNLINNTSKLIVSIQTIIQLNFKESMKGAKHKFNHVMISPDGEKMMFLHRWFLKDGRRYDSLYIANIDGSNVKLISDDDMVSHCFWFDESYIIAYLRDKTLGDKYYIIDTLTNKKEIVGENSIDKFGDGHPNCFESKIIFDTYPDKARMKSLYLYDFKSNQLEQLGEFAEKFNYYGETRCDLHPRFSFDGKKVFFDSVHDGQRKLYYLETTL